jgi:hypothetical protein
MDHLKIAVAISTPFFLGIAYLIEKALLLWYYSEKGHVNDLPLPIWRSIMEDRK